MASADDGKRTLHAMKRSFTFMFSIKSTPSPASGLGGVAGMRGWQDFLILILAGLFKAFSDRRLSSL